MKIATDEYLSIRLILNVVIESYANGARDVIVTNSFLRLTNTHTIAAPPAEHFSFAFPAVEQ